MHSDNLAAHAATSTTDERASLQSVLDRLRSIYIGPKGKGRPDPRWIRAAADRIAARAAEPFRPVPDAQ